MAPLARVLASLLQVGLLQVLGHREKGYWEQSHGWPDHLLNVFHSQPENALGGFLNVTLNCTHCSISYRSEEQADWRCAGKHKVHLRN